MPATHELAFARNPGNELYESSMHSACHQGSGGEDGRNCCSARNESSGEDDPPLADPLTQIPDPAVPFVFPHVEKRCPHSLVVRDPPTHPG